MGLWGWRLKGIQDRWWKENECGGPEEDACGIGKEVWGLEAVSWGKKKRRNIGIGRVGGGEEETWEVGLMSRRRRRKRRRSSSKGMENCLRRSWREVHDVKVKRSVRKRSRICCCDVYSSHNHSFSLAIFYNVSKLRDKTAILTRTHLNKGIYVLQTAKRCTQQRRWFHERCSYISRSRQWKRIYMASSQMFYLP